MKQPAQCHTDDKAADPGLTSGTLALGSVSQLLCHLPLRFKPKSHSLLTFTIQLPQGLRFQYVLTF